MRSQDLVTLRKAAAIGSPLALAAAKLRGIFDAIRQHKGAALERAIAQWIAEHDI